MANFNHAGITIEFRGRLPLNASSSHQYLISRLLLGTVAVAIAPGRKKPQSVNFSVIPHQPQSDSPAVAMKHFVSGMGITVKKFISITRADNRRFYSELLAELLHFFAQSNKGSHTAAFVFLYRTLERISFAVPLMYAATERDYCKTFKDLQNFLDAKSGELGFFKKFINAGNFIDTGRLNILYDVNIVSPSGFTSDFYNALDTLFTFDQSNQGIHQFKLKFSKIGDLLITLRNRFFHFRAGDGQPNITLIDVPNTDEFFGVINDVFISYLSVIVLEIITETYKQ